MKEDTKKEREGKIVVVIIITLREKKKLIIIIIKKLKEGKIIKLSQNDKIAEAKSEGCGATVCYSRQFQRLIEICKSHSQAQSTVPAAGKNC